METNLPTYLAGSMLLYWRVNTPDVWESPYASMVQLVLGCQGMSGGRDFHKDDHDEHVEVSENGGTLW